MEGWVLCGTFPGIVIVTAQVAVFHVLCIIYGSSHPLWILSGSLLPEEAPFQLSTNFLEKRTEICDVIAFGFSPFVESPSEFSTLGKRKTLKTVNGASPLRVDRFFSWQKRK